MRFPGSRLRRIPTGENRASARSATGQLIGLMGRCKEPWNSRIRLVHAPTRVEVGTGCATRRLTGKIWKPELDMRLKIVQFLAVVLTALALVPGGAHVFALPNKVGLAADQYFIVQNIYRGWSLLGIVLVGALIVDLMLTLMLRRQGGGFRAGAARVSLHGDHACRVLRLDLSSQSGDRQLDDHPGQLGATAPALGVFARRQRGRDFCGAMLRHPVRLDDAEMNDAPLACAVERRSASLNGPERLSMVACKGRQSTGGIGNVTVAARRRVCFDTCRAA